MRKAKQQIATLTTRVTHKTTTQYLLYLPSSYARRDQPWPLMLFLHGAGERGSDIELVKRHGPPKLVEHGKRFPCIIVSPQCPDDRYWSITVLASLLDEVQQQYNVDPARIYVTGISMGGHGTWELAIAYPRRFAAVAPICGWGDASVACSLKDVPVWVFHGKKDRIVPVEASEAMVSTLKACGGNVRFTVYPDAGHDSWTETYNNPSFFKWLLRQRRDEQPE